MAYLFDSSNIIFKTDQNQNIITTGDGAVEFNST